MSAPKILVQEERGRPHLSTAPDFGWSLLGLLGVVFFAVGGVDLVLTWYPPNFGNAEWEFGTVSASLDGLPVLTLGLGLLLGAGAARGQRWLMRSVAVVFVLLALLILVWALMYATNIPIALQAVTQPAVRTGLKKAMAKTACQSVLYPAAFALLAIRAWRHSAGK
jgi:hypothetical protein